MTVELFGTVSSPACANYALQHTADDNEESNGTKVANTLTRNFYVDDVLKSGSTEDETIKLAKDVKAVCENAGFNLTKFVGNTEHIIESIPDKHRVENVKNLTLDRDKLPIERALGVIWCIKSDTFNFRKALFKNTSSLRTLDPVLDSDGVMRVGGRVRKANLPCTLKNSIILPKSIHLTSLIIGHVHERTHHSGRGITLNELRSSGYWIVS